MFQYSSFASYLSIKTKFFAEKLLFHLIAEHYVIGYSNLYSTAIIRY